MTGTDVNSLRRYQHPTYPTARPRCINCFHSWKMRPVNGSRVAVWAEINRRMEREGERERERKNRIACLGVARKPAITEDEVESLLSCYVTRLPFIVVDGKWINRRNINRRENWTQPSRSSFARPISYPVRIKKRKKKKRKKKKREAVT